MSKPILNQAFTFSGDQSSAGSVFYVPDVAQGQFVEYKVYIVFDHTSAAGTVKIEEAPPNWATAANTLTWAQVGSDISWTAIDTVKAAAVTAVSGAIRIRISSNVTSGTATGWIIAASHAP